VDFDCSRIREPDDAARWLRTLRASMAALDQNAATAEAEIVEYDPNLREKSSPPFADPTSRSCWAVLGARENLRDLSSRRLNRAGVLASIMCAARCFTSACRFWPDQRGSGRAAAARVRALCARGERSRGHGFWEWRSGSRMDAGAVMLCSSPIRVMRVAVTAIALALHFSAINGFFC